LTWRIARLLRASADESYRVLALTFTNKAADEMRARIDRYAPGTESRLFVGTFHGYCAEVLRQSGTAIDIPSGFKIYGEEADREAVLAEALDSISGDLGGIRESDRRSLRLINHIQQSLTLPEAPDEETPNPSGELRVKKIYRAYNATLRNHGALDYNSLILRSYELFSKFPRLADRQRLIYRYACLDEFQDTNSSQYRLIRLLFPPPSSNVFAVADDDQVIYQWNGADYRRLIEFSRDYRPEAMQLPVNYRCPAEIVELSNRLINHNFGRFKGKAPAAAGRPPSSGDAVRLLPAYDNFQAEASGVADEFAALASIEGICVLARRNALLGPVSEALTGRNVDCVVLQRKAEFQTPPLVWLHSCLRLAADRQDDESFRSLCGAFVALTGLQLDPDEIAAEAFAAGKDLFSAWQRTVAELYPEPDFARALHQLSHLGNRDLIGEAVGAVKAWLQHLSESSGSTDSGLSSPSNDAGEEWIAWSSLYNEIIGAVGREPDLDTLLQELDMRSKEAAPRPSAVHLMTIHGSKGREYRRVFLIGMVEDELPAYMSCRQGPASPEMEEERRACYVAITRAESHLTMSLAREYFGRRREPSRFLTEMRLSPQ
jgi:DNA helicase-2/ATP-dependent DNA helicase PcrA